MIRVFQTDLLRACHDDLFTVPLPPQSISMRYGEPRVVQALQSGNAQYLGSLVVGDEIEMDFPVSMLMVRLASIYNSSRSLVEGTLHGNIGLLMDSLTRRS